MTQNASSPDFLKEIEAYDREQEEEIKLEKEREKQAKELEDKLLSDYLEKTDRRRAVESLKSNINTIQQGYSKVWRSGIKELDDKLDGGFHPKQLVFIGAISSLGKTSLALQIADNVARSGRDVLIFSLEMDSDELLSKSISRESYLLSCGDKSKERYRLTTQDILSGRIGRLGDPQRDFFEEALQKTQEVDGHLFYYIGENDVDVDLIRATVETHRRARKKSPLVIIDYLQIMRPSDDALSRRLDKRLLTDDDVTKLRVMARECEIPVIALSAFNRDSYLQTVTTSSFKESSGIEYSSDVLLGMQYADMGYKKIRYRDKESGELKTGYESKQKHELRVRELFDKMDKSDVRPLELKILKNRNGRKGSIFLKFIAPYNYFKEDTPKSDEYIEDDYIPFEEESDDVIETV